MKKLIFTMACLFFCICLYSQAPQKMSYQSVLRNAEGTLLANQTVGIKISILRNGEDGIIVFEETHNTSTNSNGLISLVIGEGEEVTGKIETINWGIGPYFLKLDTDPNGGTDYTISGATQLLSVPYALYAENAGGGDTDWTEDMANNVVYTDRNIALISGGLEFFKVNANAPAGIPRALAWTDQGIGFHGLTNIGFGVRGESMTGVGVHGLASNLGSAVKGEAKSGVGIEGLSEGGAGVFGKSDLTHSIQGSGQAAGKVGIYGTAKLYYGVLGITEDKNFAGILGDGQNLSDGVHGMASIKTKSGVLGIGLDEANGVKGQAEKVNGVVGVTQYTRGSEDLNPGNIGKGTDIFAGVAGIATNTHGVYGTSVNRSAILGHAISFNGITGGSDSKDRNHAAIYGAAADVHGVFGNSTLAFGVMGMSRGSEEDLSKPGTITFFEKKNSAGVLGSASDTYGVIGQSGGNAGVIGISTGSNGVTGGTSSSDPEKAGVTGLSSETSGILGWSTSGSGVRGKSDSGIAGEFEGEVHIENGGKNAKLKIDMMEEDNEAPCLVWSGDKYVRKRDCWTVEEEGGQEYFVSSKGIKLTVGDNTVFQVNPDGTSLHTGLETFSGGLEVPVGNGYFMKISPTDGISIVNPATNDFVWHANTVGDSFAKNSFSTVFLSANSVAAGSLDATLVSANVKQFKIDHPLDPDNKHLVHASVESNEMMNIYSGNIHTDEDGYATVVLPEWFESLNKDYRYALTPIGAFAQAIIHQEVKDGKFRIRTDKPNVKISWQVTGVRQDTWAKANPLQVEQVKPLEK